MQELFNQVGLPFRTMPLRLSAQAFTTKLSQLRMLHTKVPYPSLDPSGSNMLGITGSSGRQQHQQHLVAFSWPDLCNPDTNHPDEVELPSGACHLVKLHEPYWQKQVLAFGNALTLSNTTQNTDIKSWCGLLQSVGLTVCDRALALGVNEAIWIQGHFFRQKQGVHILVNLHHLDAGIILQPGMRQGATGVLKTLPNLSTALAALRRAARTRRPCAVAPSLDFN